MLNEKLLTFDIEENEFIDTSRLVYDGVREVRQAVLPLVQRGAEGSSAGRTLLRYVTPAIVGGSYVQHLLGIIAFSRRPRAGKRIIVKFKKLMLRFCSGCNGKGSGVGDLSQRDN